MGEKTKKRIKWGIGIAAVLGSMTYLILKNKNLINENTKLIKEVSNLEGRVSSQSYIISGLQRQVERVSYINGKLSKNI